MVKVIILSLLLAGCGVHKATGYNVKTSVGQTQYDDGRSNFYTGASVDIHFEVK